MSFPDIALLHALKGVKYDVLRTRVIALSDRYRSEAATEARPALQDDLDCLAYAVVRMPATFRALHAALLATRRQVDADVRTHLDLGGGTGAAALAAATVWPGVTTEIVEREPAAVRLGRQLAAGNYTWSVADLRQWTPQRNVDLITIGYVLNELTSEARRKLVSTAARTATTVVIVEPGTPGGHRRTLEARDLLIGHGLTIAAPCPHQLACPLDWCHFAVRLPRTELHRVLKDGTRNFEDEKFTYVVATRAPVHPTAGRVVARPVRPKGRVILDLCTASGVRERIVVPRSADGYRAARDLGWGDAVADQSS
jgi:ribosomal protein RSM22 (predicted rRNA methylase)